MSTYQVPLIIRGEVIDAPVVSFEGRHGGVSFAATDVRAHLDRLPLTTPSALSDLYGLSFEDILAYIDQLRGRLHFDDNPFLQEAFSLSKQTSGLSEPILERVYRTLADLFDPAATRELVENTIGVAYLEGWVRRQMSNGAVAGVRAMGARVAHIIAGNSPSVAAMTVQRNMVLRSDAIIKTPSNDPLTAVALARTMIGMAPDHPLTRHLSVAYWKGGDEAVEGALYHPKAIEKIAAWGGLASIGHIARYIQPGIDLVTFDPKLSSTIIGREAFADDAVMADVAVRCANDIGAMNQEGCVSARVIYIECGVDAEGLKKANRFGKLVYEALQRLPQALSTPAVRLERLLAEEIQTLKIMSDRHRVFGGDAKGAIVVSQVSEPVDFARMLANRVANLVPVDSLEIPIRSVTAYTQTIGIYPNSLKAELRDRLAFHGAQRLVSLGYASKNSFVGPQDGFEPMRRLSKWIVEEDYEPASTPLPSEQFAEWRP